MGAPLAGRRVVVTRAESQTGALAAALRAEGAEPIAFSTIRIAPPSDPSALREALARTAQFDWIVFTSTNAVERVWAALGRTGAAQALRPARICAVGPATAAALRRRGVEPALVPGKARGEGVVEALGALGELRARRILLPRAETAPPELPDALRAAGARVTEAAAYRTLPSTDGAARMRVRLRAGEVDAVTLASGSAARGFAAAVGTDLGTARVATIGPVTTRDAREAGLPVHAEALEPTVAGLVNAVIRAFHPDS
jgi:uroporphyrinogen III methyltransferase / synthase